MVVTVTVVKSSNEVNTTFVVVVVESVVVVVLESAVVVVSESVVVVVEN